MTQEQSPRVVVGVDGGPGSAGAVQYAADEARRRGAELRLVHVVPTYVPVSPLAPALVQELTSAGEEILEQARTQLAETTPDLVVSTRRLTGPRIAALVDAADGAALLVVGRETRSGLERLMGAGTTAAVATHARVPVVVVPQQWAVDGSTGPVVVGLKSSMHADELLGAAFRAAAEHDVALVVVHTWRLPDEYLDRIEVRSHVDDWIARGEELAQEALAPWRREYPDVPVSVAVTHDDPAHALVRASEGASLVVLLRRPPAPVFGQHLGGTARAVIRAAACPVQIVPGTDLDTEMADLQVEASGAMLR
jgi:nucleotide-binding universal stress UspA family protein